MNGSDLPDTSPVAGGHDASPAGEAQADAAREAELARAAAAGDGHAFASLYESYEKRIYNYCLRILGGTSDAEDATQEAFLKVFDRLSALDPGQLNFGAYLFTAARNASYDMIERRRRTEPVADLPDDGSGHLHRERADADVEPERAAMLANQQASVRAASERLPVRQREVLALREVEGMSYAEIAGTMGMNPNAVAQLISRARTGLRSELRLGVASAVPPASADCERALPLLAMKQDAELADPGDRIWLDAHLAGCAGCRLSAEEMAEAGISYRAWAPVAPALYLFRDTLAKAAESIGADWSAVERPDSGSAGQGSGSGGTGSQAPASGSGGTSGGASGAGAEPASRLRFRTGSAVAAAVVVGIFAGIFAGQVADSTIEPSSFPASSAVSPARDGQGPGSGSGGDRNAQADQPQGEAATATETPAGQPSPAPATTPDPQGVPGGSGPDQTPPDAGQPGGGNPGGDSPGGGGSPVTPPTPPTNPPTTPPSEPPRDPKDPGTPPTSVPPVITNPNLPGTPPRVPTVPPASTPGIRG